jgi:hypothetical protein
MPKKQPGSDSRGDFFKKGAVVGAGATTLAGQAAQPRRGRVQFGSVADVVIVGGASGLPDAIMARDQGAPVIVTLRGSLTPYRD